MTVTRMPSRKPAGAIDWAVWAACKDKTDFLDWPQPAKQDEVCAVCPVRRECHRAGLTPQQIRDMP